MLTSAGRQLRGASRTPGADKPGGLSGRNTGLTPATNLEIHAKSPASYNATAILECPGLVTRRRTGTLTVPITIVNLLTTSILNYPWTSRQGIGQYNFKYHADVYLRYLILQLY